MQMTNTEEAQELADEWAAWEKLSDEALILADSSLCSDHKLEPACNCGANMICLSCGFGYGSIPCKCIPKIELTYDFNYRFS